MKKDKVLHFLVGLIVTLGLSLLGLTPMTIFVIVFLIAFSKELYDEITYGGFDWYDLIATIIPTLLLIVL